MRERLRGYLLWILSPVYGLLKAGSYWGAYYMGLFVRELSMTSTLIDKNFLYRHTKISRSQSLIAEQEAQVEAAAPSLKRALRLRLERHSTSRPDGFAAVLVNETLFAGTSAFRRDERAMHANFKMGVGSDLSDGPLKFGGLEVEAVDEHLIFHQRQYLAQRVATLKLPAGTATDKTAVKREAGTIGWMSTMTCPHASFLISQLNQITVSDSAALKLINKSVERALKFAPVGMRINRMDLRSLYIAAYSDASLTNNADLSSQISGVIVFHDSLGNAALAHYWSRKFQRVTPSTLSGEAIALTTVFDSAFMLRNAVSEILGRRISLFAFTDSYSLFQIIAKSNPVREKRLMIDAAILREAYSSGSLDNLGFIRTRFNHADPLSKNIENESLLLRILAEGKLNHDVAEFVIEEASLPRPSTHRLAAKR